MFKVYREISPHIVSSMFERNNESHSLNTRYSNHFHLPRNLSNLFQKSIRYSGVKILNKTLGSGNLNSCFTVLSFKRILKSVSLNINATI